MKKIIGPLSVGLFVIGLTASAQAAPVKFSFSGDITSVTPGFYLNTIGITDSSTFTGSFIYDTEAAPYSPTDPNYAIYPVDTHLTITIDNSITISNYINSQYGSLAYVTNDDAELTSYQGSDKFATHSSQLQSSHPEMNSQFLSGIADSVSAFRLAALQGDVWDDTSLPTSFDLTNFDEATITISSILTFAGSDPSWPGHFIIQGEVTEISTLPVPLPSSSILLLSGITGLLGARVRKKKTAIAN